MTAQMEKRRYNSYCRDCGKADERDSDGQCRKCGRHNRVRVPHNILRRSVRLENVK